MALRIAILSADRSEFARQPLPDGRSRGTNYIVPMLESLAASGALDRKDLLPIPIVVGTLATSYLGRGRNDPAFQVLPMTPQQATAFGLDDLTPVQRCALNYIMLWRHAVEKMEWDRLLVLEDDVILSPGWLEYLERVLCEVDRAYKIPPLVTLYRPLDRLMATYLIQEASWFEVANPIRHWGLQGYVYHRSHFFDMSQFFKNVMATVVMNSQPQILEWVLWRHLEKIDKEKARIAMVATCPCLIQHHGDESLVGSGIHRALHVWGDTVRLIDASEGPLQIQLPVLERPDEDFYVRRLDGTAHPVEIFQSDRTRLATINARGVFSFRRNQFPNPRGGIPPGHPQLRPLRTVPG